MYKPEIAIITAVHDDVPVKYFDKALYSVFNQTLIDKIELILIMNGDCEQFDDTIDRYYSLVDDWFNLVLMLNDKDKSFTKSIEQALRRTSCKYIGFQDSDDFCDTTKFEQQHNYMKSNSNVGIVGTNVNLVDARGNNNNGTWLFYNNPNDYWGINPGNGICGGTMLIKKELFELCNAPHHEFPYCWDYRFCVEAWKKEIQMTNIQKLLYSYRQWDGQISRINKKAQIIEHNKILKIAREHRQRVGE